MKKVLFIISVILFFSCEDEIIENEIVTEEEVIEVINCSDNLNNIIPNSYPSKSDILDLFELFDSELNSFNLANEDIVNIPIQFYLFDDENNQSPLSSNDIDDILVRINNVFNNSKISFTNCSGNINIDYNSQFYDMNFNQNLNVASEIIGIHNNVEAINIYVVGSITDSTPINAFTEFPREQASIQNLNYLFIDKDYMINAKTLEHELGHFFGLLHTHEDWSQISELIENIDGSNCECSGDFICDTPASPVLAYWDNGMRNDDRIDENCNYVENTNTDYSNGGNIDMQVIVSNFMSYTKTTTDCRTSFTPEQIKRIGFTARNKRFQLIRDCDTENIFNGNVILLSQQEVDNFTANNYTAINGYLFIGEQGIANDISNISEFSSLTSISGDGMGNALRIDYTLLTSLEGFNNVENINGTISIANASSLNNISQLSNITSTSFLQVFNCDDLTNLNGLQNIQSVGGVSIVNNNNLTQLSLQNLTTCSATFELIGNNSLSNLNDLSNFSNTNNLWITSNNQLNNYCGLLDNLIVNNGISGNYTIANNLYNPTLQNLIDGNCSN